MRRILGRLRSRLDNTKVYTLVLCALVLLPFAGFVIGGLLTVAGMLGSLLNTNWAFDLVSRGFTLLMASLLFGALIVTVVAVGGMFSGS